MMKKKHAYFRHQFLTFSILFYTVLIILVALILTLLVRQTEILIIWIPILLQLFTFAWFRVFILSRVHIYSTRIEINYIGKPLSRIEYSEIENYRIIKQFRTYYLKIETSSKDYNVYISKRILKRMNEIAHCELLSKSFKILFSELKTFRWE